MTTLLSNPLSREVLLEGEPFKVTISPSGVRITRKGHRKSAEIAWDNILALSNTESRAMSSRERTESTDVPEAIAADVAREIKKAKDALQEAADVLVRAGSLPVTVLSGLEPDPVYGRVEHDSDWFIEPLLTVDEVASLLRISKQTAVNLPISQVTIGGQRRFRRSEIRRYLSQQSTA
jgi:excisionase family DNA binding protein